MITIDRPYTGHVSPGSNPQQRDLEGARVLKMAVGAMDNNVYLVQCAATGAALLIDAANEPERILELVAQEAPGKIKLIVTTHQHPDHWWALEEVAKTLGVPTAAHRLDADPLPVTPDRYLEDGDVLEIGDLPSPSTTCAATPPARSPSPSPKSRAAPTCSPATPCSPAGSERPTTQRISPPCSRTSPRNSSPIRTTRWCIRGTVTTRRSGSSGRIWRSGANGGGES